MPFSQKKNGSMYQKLMNRFLRGIVYIDDIIDNSLKSSSHLKNLEDIFKQFESYNMKLYLVKCIFGVR